jgi:hypothetical protein
MLAGKDWKDFQSCFCICFGIFKQTRSGKKKSSDLAARNLEKFQQRRYQYMLASISLQRGHFILDLLKLKFLSCSNVKLIQIHQESRTLQNVDIAPQHRSSKNESIQTIIFIQPGLSLHPFFLCRITR